MTIKKTFILIVPLLLNFLSLQAKDVDEISYKQKIKKIYPMGKKLFTKKCNQNIDLNNYATITKLKEDIKHKNICKYLKKKQLQALSLYLWEVKRVGDAEKIQEKIIVKKDDKCPVCGMFTYKYPRWASQIFYKNTSKEHHYSFDGVKSE